MSELFDSLNFPSQRSFGASPSQRATFGVASGSQSSSQTSETGHNALKRTPFRGEGAVGSASTAPTSGTTPAKVWNAGAGAGGSSSVQRRPAGHVYWHASPSPSMAAAATCEDVGSHAQVSPLGTQAFKEELLRGQQRQDPTFRKSTSAEKRAKRRARGENEDGSQHLDHDQRTRKAARQSKRGDGSSLGNQRRQGLGLELESFLANLEGRLQLDDDYDNDDYSQDTGSAEGAINSSTQRQPDRLMGKARSLSQDTPLLSHRRVPLDKCVETDGASFGPSHQDDVTGNKISNGAARGPWTKTASSPCLGRLSACHQQHGCFTAVRPLGQPFLPASKIGVEVEARDVFANDMKQMDAINENDDGKGAVPVEDRPPLQPVNTQRYSASPAKGVARKQNVQHALASEVEQQEQKPLQGIRRSARTPVKAASISALQARPAAPCLDEEAKSLRSSAAPSQFLGHGSAAAASITSGRSLGVGLSRAKSGPMMTTRSRVGLSRSSSSHQRSTHLHGASPDAGAAIERLSSSPTKGVARNGPGAPFKRPSRVPSTASMKKRSCKSEVVVISDDSDEDTAGWQSPNNKVHGGPAPAPSTAVDTFENFGTTGKGHDRDLGHVQANDVDVQKGGKEALSNAQDCTGAVDEGTRHVGTGKPRACVSKMSKGLEGIERGEMGSNTTSRASRSPDKALRSSIANPKPRIIGGGQSNATTPLRKRRGPAAVSGEDAAQAEMTRTDSRNKKTDGGEASRQQQQQPGSDDSFEMEHLTELDEMLTAIGC